MAVAATTRTKKVGVSEAKTANRVMEATVSGMVPMIPNPLEGLGFGEGERKAVIKKLQTLFPNASEDAIQTAVFGGPRKSLSEVTA